jgi:hypothetical protein
MVGMQLNPVCINLSLKLSFKDYSVEFIALNNGA